MSDLTHLLERAAGPEGSPADATTDLTRGRRALARTRVRRATTGLAGVAAVGVLGVALSRGGDDGAAPIATDPSVAPTVVATPTAEGSPGATEAPTQAPTVASSPTVAADPSAPVTGPAAPTFYSVPATPDGWVVQGSSPYGVTWARPGDTTVPEDFEGKLVLMFSTNRRYGEQQLVDGRPFWVLDNGDGYTRITVKTRADEPKGNLELQYPTAQWTPEQAIAFLSGVRALDGAEPAVG